MNNYNKILIVLFTALVALVESCSGKTEKAHSVNTVAYYDDMPQRSRNTTTYFYKDKYSTLIPQHYNLTLFISS